MQFFSLLRSLAQFHSLKFDRTTIGQLFPREHGIVFSLESFLASVELWNVFDFIWSMPSTVGLSTLSHRSWQSRRFLSFAIEFHRWCSLILLSGISLVSDVHDAAERWKSRDCSFRWLLSFVHRASFANDFELSICSGLSLRRKATFAPIVFVVSQSHLTLDDQMFRSVLLFGFVRSFCIQCE